MMQRLLLLSGTIVFFLVSCATYQNEIYQARESLADGQPEAAIQILEDKANTEGKDQVLFLLDYGIALHQAKDYKKSIDVFLKADKLAEAKDYTSITRQAGSLLINEGMLEYKSERFENILINGYLALNFLMIGDYDEALVECRRIDEKLRKLKFEGEKASKNFFARYLSAMIWEAQGQWDSAYIDYKNAFDINPHIPHLKEDLIRSAWRARRFKSLTRWQKSAPNVNLKALKQKVANQGELILVYQQGWIPRKQPRYNNRRFPELIPTPANEHTAWVTIDQGKGVRAKMVYNVGRDATQTLNRAFKYLVAKKVIGYVAKEVVADQIRQKDQALGFLAAVAMHVSDRADLRQWSTLPDTFQVSRQWVSPGKHNVTIEVQGRQGARNIWEGEVMIKQGKPTFLTVRTF